MRLVMMGTGTFAEPTLEALLAGPDPVVGVFTQPDREGVVKRGSTRQIGRGMKEIAAERDVPVFQPVSVNSPDGVAMLRSIAPELLIVAAYGQILSKEVLSIPTVGAINVHGSLLPKYRGAAPIAHAILNGETETGVTIIRVSAGLDAGDMLAKGTIAIGPDETAGSVEARLAPLGARLAVETIERFKLGSVVGEKQNPSGVTKAPKLTKEMGLIDWTKPAATIARHVRAMQPWPTAYTFLHRAGKQPLRVIVNCVEPRSIATTQPPGSILAAGRLEVATGNGESVAIEELQPAGKKRQSATEFLRGYPVGERDRFGGDILDSNR